MDESCAPHARRTATHARGGLIDGYALAANRLAGAGLDVFETRTSLRRKPPPALRPRRRQFARGKLTMECAARMSVAAARNILDFFSGSLDPKLVVNAPVLQLSRLPEA